MNSYVKWVSVFANLLLAGCQIPAATIATSAGVMPAYQLPPEPDYEVPPQVIYAVDNHRFFTSENYKRCSVGHVYYNDTINKIKTSLGNALATFPGRFFLDGNPNFLIFPTSPGNGIGRCGNDKGCSLIIYYSLDGGRTFNYFHSWFLSTDLKEAYEKGKAINVVLKDNQMFLENGTYAFSYELNKGMTGAGDLVEGGPKAVPHVQTLSGQDHITCDDSILPKEIVK